MLGDHLEEAQPVVVLTKSLTETNACI